LSYSGIPTIIIHPFNQFVKLFLPFNFWAVIILKSNDIHP